VDESNTFHFKKKGGTVSKSVPESMIISLERSEDISTLKNRIYVLGGEVLDTAIETDHGTSYADNYNYALAQPFTANYNNIRNLTLYLERYGQPSETAGGRIVEDKDGQPSDVLIASFSRNDVFGADWYAFKVSGDLITGKKYWVVLDAVSQGSLLNNYRWYLSTQTGGYSKNYQSSSWEPVSGNDLSIQDRVWLSARQYRRGRSEHREVQCERARRRGHKPSDL